MDLNDKFQELLKRTTSSERRLKPKAAAEYVGEPEWKLERWRSTWREAEQEGNPALRRGPRFIQFKSGRVLYEVRDLDEYKLLAAAASSGLLPDAAAKHVKQHRRTLENWRRTWRLAEAQGKPELRKGPRFFKEGKRVWYEKRDLDEFLAGRSGGCSGNGATKPAPPEQSASM